MTNDSTRDKILARRNQFLALTMASAGVLSCAPGASQPESMAPILVSVEPPKEDDGGLSESSEGSDEADDDDLQDDEEPEVCLSVEPELRPCLSIRPSP